MKTWFISKPNIDKLQNYKLNIALNGPAVYRRLKKNYYYKTKIIAENF